ncbi:MAG: hypothetical protein H0W63_00065 [Gemmatimonadaceae bacterium]|nr:hypothetical protein [Gemmatimonadaceae bacterium]
MRKANVAGFRGYLGKNGEAFLLIALAAAVYQPWNAPGLPILDFSEFLPRLAGNSFWSGIRSVADYLASQGRFAPLQYVLVAFDWKAFGTEAAGWHWSYFAINSAVLLLARRVLLKMGVRRSAAFVAVALWALMKPFADCWLRPTGETIGLLFALSAFGIALDYAARANPRRRALLLASCAFGMLLSKEILVVLIPAIWLAARLEKRDGAFRWAPWRRGDTELIAALTTAIVLAAIPIAYVAHHASADSYASRYGAGRISFASALERFEIAFLPGREPLSTLKRVWADPAWRLLLVLPNLIWVALIADGLASPSARRNLWPIAIGVLWLFSGIVAYLPWPGHSAFYMVPFGFGMVIIAACASSWLFERSESAGWTGIATAALLVGLTAIEARNAVRRHDLRVRLDSSIIASVSRAATANEIVAAVPEPPANAASWGWAKRLAEFGRAAKKLPVLRSRDISCAAVDSARAANPRIIAVSEQEGCGIVVPQSETIRVSTFERRWPWLLKVQPFYRTGYISPIR